MKILITIVLSFLLFFCLLAFFLVLLVATIDLMITPIRESFIEYQSHMIVNDVDEKMLIDAITTNELISEV